MSGPVQKIESVHEQHISKRRARVLSQKLAEVIPQEADLLDVGCGDGEIAWMIGQQRPDLRISGVDVLVRDQTHIPVDKYDGVTLPYDDQSIDVVTLIDVLHHCDQPVEVLREATRVARRAVVIKDHKRDGLAAAPTLRFMDWVGNNRYGVALPYNYLSTTEWLDAFDELNLQVKNIVHQLNIYPWPASLIFDRSLHFIACLTPANNVEPFCDTLHSDAKTLAV